MQVFTHHLSLSPLPVAALAAELVQAPFEGSNPWEEAGPSHVKQLHVQLLSLVNQDHKQSHCFQSVNILWFC